MSITPETTPGRSSRRVEAWIYTIINPLIDVTRSEAHLLERRNLSWRHYSRRAEYIRRICEYIEPHNAPNLEDFLADNEKFTQKFDRHDKTLQVAEQNAATFFDTVTSAPIFIKEVNEAVQQYELMRATSQAHSPSADSLGPNLANYVAEYLVNDMDTLPSTYTTHRFWQLFGQRFQAYKERESFLSLQKAVRDFRDASLDLRQNL